MSAFGRAFLRLAACAALRNQTMAGERVYDSRISAIDPVTAFPVLDQLSGSIGVYTEQDSGDALSSNNGGPPFRPEIELIFEIVMQGRMSIGSDEWVIARPETDDQLEATIDVIEGQVELALFRYQTPAAVAFRKLTKQVASKTSIRFTDPSGSSKLAMRYLTYKVEIADPEIDIFNQSATGINRLPQPWRLVAEAFPTGSREREMSEAIAASLVTDPLPALLRIGATVKPTPTASTVSALWEPPQ
jgi:hypothetical protein